jgi:hypothetical protein
MSGDNGAGIPDFLGGFLGFVTIESARDALASFDAALRADVNVAYSAPYMKAAAAIEHFEPAEYARLVSVLKGKGINIGRWASAVREYARRERVRIAEGQKGAQFQAAQRTNAAASIKLREVEPAAQPVTDGGLLLSDVKVLIRRFVRIGANELVAVVLWIAFTYAFAIAEYSVRLAILSAKMRSGKSRLETIIGLLCSRVLHTSNLSPSTVYRAIEELHPLLLFDEVDSFMFAGRGGQESERTREMRNIVNSGHHRDSANVGRTEKEGDRQIIKFFSTWCPMVHAAIGSLPNTWEDRSFIIMMKRRLKTESVERLTRRNRKAVEAEAAVLASKLARWIADNLDHLSTAEPELPDVIDDRVQDNWELPLAIADLAGETWGAAARKAAIALSAGRDEGADNSLDIKLLVDIGTILSCPAYEARDTIGSTALAEALAAIKDAPWSNFGRSKKPITTRRLAMMLRPFGIFPAHQHGQNEYEIAALADLILRYAPKSDVQSFIASQTLGAVGENANFEASQEADGEALKNSVSATAPMSSEAMKLRKHVFENGAQRDSVDDDFDTFEAGPTDDAENGFPWERDERDPGDD